MDYQQALDYVLGRTDYERVAGINKSPPKFHLRRMELLMERLGDPQRAIPAVHIAGTKGKGSTAAMIASVLSSAGYRTGLYTSPHLHTMRERICIDGELIGEEEFAAHVGRIRPAVAEVDALGEYSPISTFEVLTALAFLHFRDAGAQFQVLEVGLGGRLDATNVILPLVSVITTLGLDHTEVLGDTLAKIAWEKAGIIKPGVPVVSASQEPEAQKVLEEVANERRAPLTWVSRATRKQLVETTLRGQNFRVTTPRDTYELWMPLLGAHQMENAAAALLALEELAAQGIKIPGGAITEGFKRVSWSGRLEVLKEKPLLVVDGAHNPLSAGRIAQAVKEVFHWRRLILLVGVNGDKDMEGIVQELSSLKPHVIATQSRHPKATPADRLASSFSARGLTAESTSNVTEGLKVALQRAEEGDLILATGSLFLTAEVIQEIKGIAPERYPSLESRPAGTKP